MRCADCENEGERDIVHDVDCQYAPTDGTMAPSVPPMILCGNCDEPFAPETSPVTYLDFGCWMMEQEDPAKVIEFVEKQQALMLYYQSGTEAGLRAQQTIVEERVQANEVRDTLANLVRWVEAADVTSSGAVGEELSKALDAARSIVSGASGSGSTQSDGRWHVPFTDQQVVALSHHQRDPHIHPYTCPEHSEYPLAPGREDLRCTQCDYCQTWAHAIERGANEGHKTGVHRLTTPVSDKVNADYAVDVYGYAAYGPGKHDETRGHCANADELQQASSDALRNGATEVILTHTRRCRHCQSELESHPVSNKPAANLDAKRSDIPKMVSDEVQASSQIGAINARAQEACQRFPSEARAAAQGGAEGEVAFRDLMDWIRDGFDPMPSRIRAHEALNWALAEYRD